MDIYYKITDLNLIGKMEKGRYPRVWNPVKKDWTGKSVLLMDRIVGYDDTAVGSTDMMSRLVKITEDEAMQIVNA